MIKIKELSVGQKIKNSAGVERRVIEVLQNSVALQSLGNPECFGGWYTEYELKNCEAVVEPWDPETLKIGEDYFFLDTTGVVKNDFWNADPVDNFRLKSGNIYKTVEDATIAYNKIMQL